eukprot:4476703-Amphidinium_carterae.1
MLDLRCAVQNSFTCHQRTQNSWTNISEAKMCSRGEFSRRKENNTDAVCSASRRDFGNYMRSIVLFVLFIGSTDSEQLQL